MSRTVGSMTISFAFAAKIERARCLRPTSCAIFLAILAALAYLQILFVLFASLEVHSFKWMQKIEFTYLR